MRHRGRKQQKGVLGDPLVGAALHRRDRLKTKTVEKKLDRKRTRIKRRARRKKVNEYPANFQNHIQKGVENKEKAAAIINFLQKAERSRRRVKGEH